MRDATRFCSCLVLALALVFPPGAASETAKRDDPAIDRELARAGRLMGAGQPGRAAAVIRALLPRRDSAEIRHLLGEAEEAAGDRLAAAEEYQKAAHMDPTEENLFDWGNNLLQLRAYPPATDVLSEAVRRYPRSARLQVALGIARYSRGQYDDAIRSFCAAADLDPRDARPYLFLGEMYGVSAALSPEITRRLARFVEARPRHALGHFYYAMSVWKSDPGAAPSRGVEDHLRKAASLDPRLAKARFQLGVLYSDQRRYPEAVAALQEAVRLDPGMAQAHYRLAQAYRRTGREDLAQKELEAFERLQPGEATPSPPPPGGPGFGARSGAFPPPSRDGFTPARDVEE
ncbi:MAG: hypothetical protein DMF81_15990 [Acidobacteria bacterium]|nr:MAG: hypothetical protein DMF81_15990 [Acidobacteriota bacterium]